MVSFDSALRTLNDFPHPGIIFLKWEGWRVGQGLALAPPFPRSDDHTTPLF